MIMKKPRKSLTPDHNLLQVVKVEIKKYFDNHFKDDVSAIPVEKPITLYVNDIEVVTLMATYSQLEELAIGFLTTSGLIDNLSEIKELLVDQRRSLIWAETKKSKSLIQKIIQHRIIGSGCGGSDFFQDVLVSEEKQFSNNLKAKSEDLLELTSQLIKSAKIYKISGGIHGVGLAQGRQLLAFAEDVGRHNALDKVIGEMLKKDIDPRDKILVTTGRISAEMLLKSLRAKIAILVSRTSPTSLAVEMAKRTNTTLVGYAHGQSLVIYCHDWRVQE
jgi:FdhD protein